MEHDGHPVVLGREGHCRCGRTIQYSLRWLAFVHADSSADPTQIVLESKERVAIPL